MADTRAKVCTLVAILMRGDSMTAAAIADETELGDATVHLWLRSFADAGLVLRDGSAPRPKSRRGVSAYLWRWAS